LEIGIFSNKILWGKKQKLTSKVKILIIL